MSIKTKIKRLAIIGVGLIGGSFGVSLRYRGAVEEIVGYGRNIKNLGLAKELGLIDRWTTNIDEAVSHADIVLIATPVGAMPAVFDLMKDAIAPECIITDVGSVKQVITEAFKNSFLDQNVHFIPGHPIAGREVSGPAAADGDLFVGKTVILTPEQNTDVDAISRIQELWQLVGSKVICMSPERHDRLLALTSHLPHVMAYTLVNLLKDEEDQQQDTLNFAAGGFYDLSRIASSDPIMWRDICLTNNNEIVSRLESYQNSLSHMIDILEAKDGAALEKLFNRARETRERIKQLNKH
jgi:prephenate dehydrogenase